VETPSLYTKEFILFPLKHMHKCLDKDECLTNGIPSPKDGLPPKNFSAPNLSDDEVVAIIFLIDEELPLIAVLDNEDIWGILIWFGSHY
jgi:hypothetical protein